MNLAIAVTWPQTLGLDAVRQELGVVCATSDEADEGTEREELAAAARSGVEQQRLNEQDHRVFVKIVSLILAIDQR